MLRQGDARMRLRFVSESPLRLEVKGLRTPEAAVHASYRDRKRQGDFLAVITLDQADAPVLELTTERHKDSLKLRLGEQLYRVSGHTLEVITEK